jgi:CRISPR-associated protein Csd1
VLGKEDNIPPKLAGDVLDAIVTGGAYPRTLLASAIQRARAERDVTPDRAGAIRACLERAARRNHEGQGGVTVSLDPSNHNAGYLLGRLFAALERAQSTANPGIESGIRERYYASASATPVAAFPTLMKLKNHHLAKIENRGTVVNLERLIGSIMDGVADFPAVLSTSDQGRFALGYYHQRQAFFTKSDSNEEHFDA